MYYVPYTLFKNMLYFPHEALLSFMQFLCFMSILGYESIKNKPDSTLKKKMLTRCNRLWFQLALSF